MDELQKEVMEGLAQGKSIDAIELSCVQKGFLEADAVKAVSDATAHIRGERRREESRNTQPLFAKEFFDRMGYGLGSSQFVNILFSLSGASYVLLGAVIAIRELISAMFSSFLKEFSAEHEIGKQAIGMGGIVFGFCFILMAIARCFSLVWLFPLAILGGVVGIVAQGESYHRLKKHVLGDRKVGAFALLHRYGLIITVASLLLGAYLLDTFPAVNLAIPLIGQLNITGYLIVFECTAICFILSGYMISHIKTTGRDGSSIKEAMRFVPVFLARIRQSTPKLFSNTSLVLLFLADTLVGLAQVLGNCFYGVFIYNFFKYMGFGGYLNVAMIFVLALLASLITPSITHLNTKAYGKFPMIVFGTMLMAIMPLTFFYNPNLVSIAMGTILGVSGAAIVGIAHGLLTSDIIPIDMRESYFSMYGLWNSLPYLAAVPLGGYIAQVMGLRKMFLIIGLILVLVVVPLYLIIMVIHEKRGIQMSSQGLNTKGG